MASPKSVVLNATGDRQVYFSGVSHLRTYGLTDLRTYRLTDLPTYRLTDLPTYQLTDLGEAAYQLKMWH
ncbi:hypothetical protein GCM10027085_19550 [Spirosoma aerophilum]